MSTPKIVVVLKGGFIRDVITDTEIELLVVDHDTDGYEDEKLTTFNMEEEFRAYAYVEKPCVTEDTSEYFDQYNEAR